MASDPVTLRRALRVELRRRRMDRRLTQRQVAEELDWSTSKVIRIESGTNGVSITDLRALLLLYNVTDDKYIDRLCEMARGSRRQPFSEYKDDFTSETLRYFAYESAARTVRSFEPLIVPGLLQTESYGMTLLEAYGVDVRRADNIWKARHERQWLLDRESAPTLTFVIDESALRRSVGGPSVMREQLVRLIERSQQRNISLHVLPFSMGAHSGLRGAFTCLEFDEPSNLDVLFIESSTGDYISTDEADRTEKHIEDFERLTQVALTADESREFLFSVLEDIPH